MVARRLGLSWDEAHGIQERAVRRGLARRPQEPVARLGKDEKSFLKRHQHVSLVVDLDRARVLHVADDRKAEGLITYPEAGAPDAGRDGRYAADGHEVRVVQASHSRHSGCVARVRYPGHEHVTVGPGVGVQRESATTLGLHVCRRARSSGAGISGPRTRACSR